MDVTPVSSLGVFASEQLLSMLSAAAKCFGCRDCVHEERKQDMVCPVVVESVKVLRTKFTQPTLSMLDTQLL